MVARTLNKLTTPVINEKDKKPGRYSDGGGLYLNVAAGGTKSWVFMWRDGPKKRREMGLGPYPAISLAKARTHAEKCREALAEGLDPLKLREEAVVPTFLQAADDYVNTHSSGFRNGKHLAQWKMTLSLQRDEGTGALLETGYCVKLRDMPVDRIGTEHVLSVLKPIWQEIPETASRLRGRIERILDAQRAKGHRSGENPARWRGHLDGLLPKRKTLTRGHHGALPYDDLPGFMVELLASDGMAAKALTFTILTCARTGESLGARWSEIDTAKGLWTIPGDRMKANKLHEVPLSAPVLAILAELRETATSEFVFTGPNGQSPLSSMAMLMHLRRMKRQGITAHGFRSTFRDWAGDATSFPREVAEAALAHRVGNAVEQAYRRGSALEKRRKMLDAWANYCMSKVEKENNVIPMRVA